MKVAILGAGKIGAALTKFFCEDPDVSSVIVCDKNGQALTKIESDLQTSKLRTHRVGIEKEWSLKTLIRGFDFLVSALPPKNNIKLTELAIEIGINYIDLGGTQQTFEKQLKYSDQAAEKNVCIIPNCGFAPGLISIIAMHGYEAFDDVESIKIRAAGLPVNPKPPLNFLLNFSVDALLDEYSNDAIILKDGKVENVKALEGYESLSFNSSSKEKTFEAFYTSGQITSLVKMLEGKVKNLDFKTIRYPGHRDIIKSLFQLGFGQDKIVHIKANITYRDILARQLAKNLPENDEDMSLIKITIEGKRDGDTLRRNYEMICDYDKDIDMSALIKCAALPILLTTKLIFQGKHTNSCGVFPPEKVIPNSEFLELMKEKNFNIHIDDETI